MSEKVQVQRIKNSGTKLWGSLGVLDYTRVLRRNYKHIECSIRMILIAGDDDTAKVSYSNYDIFPSVPQHTSSPTLTIKTAGITGGYKITILHRKFCT